jgi:hypothetical protein
MQRGQFLLVIYELIHELSNGKFIVVDEKCYVVVAYLKWTTIPFFWSDRRMI